MRYFILAVLVTVFIGCSSESVDKDIPSSPSNVDAPPQVPDI